MNDFSNFKFETTAVIDAESAIPADQWRVLRLLHIPDRFNNPRGGALKRGLVIDVEATGLSIEQDDIIQLAMLPFDYEVDSGRIIEVHKNQAFDALREPAVPISEEASIITGITGDMVAGQGIDGDQVAEIVNQADLIIAHNAWFDRPMVERHWNCFAEKRWSCTFTSVNWLREGFSAGKLDFLGMQFGWFYEGHQALADCEACLALLAQTLPASQRRVLDLVREAAGKPEYLIRAVGSPFEEKDTLKDRGYRWRPDGLPHGKVWWTTSTDPEAEIAWRKSEVYPFEKEIPVHELTALTRFSDRMWDFD
jgi:DNA polymerase-3 subunit epsilon